MAKVIMFSRVFPSYHLKAGQPTYFVEKLIKGFPEFDNPVMDLFSLIPLALDKFSSLKPKYHTIRKGHRFKVGDKFSPRVWLDKPYRSKQIIIAPDIEVKKTWDIEMIPSLWFDECKWFINGKPIIIYQLIKLSENDGLDLLDFVGWFCGSNIADSKRKGFKGQIICWNENICY
jgi:hypothetical protein